MRCMVDMPERQFVHTRSVRQQGYESDVCPTTAAVAAAGAFALGAGMVVS